jgi:hypothetical protein
MTTKLLSPCQPNGHVIGSRLVNGVLLLCSLWTQSVFGQVTIVGVQYQPDYYFPENDCYWNSSAYPGPCRTPVLGATVHVYVKNTGASSVTINDATLAGYSLTNVIKTSTSTHEAASIYFYWDNPPQDIIDAGEPVYYRFDPPVIPPGGVGQVAVRLRFVPTTPTVNVGVVTVAETITTNITVDANTPRITSIGYSEDLKKVYLHWRRSGGAAPTSIWLDGTDVTSLTTTVGDTSMNFGASVICLSNALPFFSYHVFQGMYADAKIAAISQRAWTNKFIYATWGTMGANWIAEATARGFNSIEVPSAGYIIDLNPTVDPDMWILNDEPDAEESNAANTSCGNGLKIPCDGIRGSGILVKREAVIHAAELRAARPNVPLSINLDSAYTPESFFNWGPAVDILQTDNYYEPRLSSSYLDFPSRIPLYKKALFSYAVARTASAAAEPNPYNHLLYCAKRSDWPFPTPQSKRFEIYYSLAGGSKGMSYWALVSHYANGLNTTEVASLVLWKEMGLCGNEIKTARNLIVKSTPVDLPIVTSTNVWARAVASGTDTLILYVVNDNYYSDIAGCHVTPVSGATVTATLPSWMQSPTAFEVTSGGLRAVNTQLAGNQLQVNLGTLNLTRMIVLTKDARLLSALQQRYEQQVRPGLCTFANEYCTNAPLNIAQQPANQVVPPGGTANFTVVAFGNALIYQWQKDNVNLTNDNHYSGCTNAWLTVSNCDSNDVASYRCVVGSATGTNNTSSATLAVPTVLTVSSIAMDINGHINITFAGGWPGSNYVVQATTNLLPAVWMNLATNVAGMDGQWTFEDPEWSAYANRYYRSAKP